MDKTPVISRPKLSRRRNNFLTENEPKESASTACSTSFLETKMFTDTENEESPVHIACTQEGYENVDVVWDWNSPQPKQKPKRSQKRLILQSPKIPLKRHPSNNHIQNFEKLREELQLLKEEISVPDNEESLVLSPLEEAEYKNISNIQNEDALPSATPENCLLQDDLFNDSVDEQLVLFSQQIESKLNAVGQIKNQLFSDNNTNSGRHSEQIDSVQISNKKSVCDKDNVKVNKLGIRSIGLKTEDAEMANTANDPFAAIIKGFGVERIEEMAEVINRTNINQEAKKGSLSFPRTTSDNQHKTFKQTNTGKVEFHRTQSFESTIEHNQDMIPQYKLHEIERKRKEALAKLESKRKQDNNSSSPTKCTPIEIERKRLQALAKLEAKRQQDSIERKRQEALKRLELSRKKNATMVKSELTKRL